MSADRSLLLSHFEVEKATVFCIAAPDVKYIQELYEEMVLRKVWPEPESNWLSQGFSVFLKPSLNHLKLT